MGRLSLDGLIGIHTNLLTPALGDANALSASPPTKEERAALDQLDTFHASGTGYFVEQATRPETIGYALLDSPIALAAWIMDHDTDSYEKIARAFVDKQPSGNLTREHIVDNITLYWLTGTGASAARSYWEEGQENARASGQPPTPVSIPVGFTTFPGEIWRTPRSWVERAYPTSRSTSTRWTRAATSPPGRNRSSSRKRCAPRSGRCASRQASARGRRWARRARTVPVDELDGS
jgi:hypothetical protein